ncbi:MAG: hypothetical protein FWD91_04225 [Treponema sp.]|nr:hypothetical protein [Treponema sp.]
MKKIVAITSTILSSVSPKTLFPLFVLAAVLGIVPVNSLRAADVSSRSIQDDSALRRTLEAFWFRETPGTIFAQQPEIHTLRGGGRVQVRTETSAASPNEFAVVLAREQDGAFPGWAQGSWVLTRRRDENHHRNSRIRVFLRSDPNTYVQFRPLGADRSQMDVVIYDAYAVRSLPVAIPFERLFVLPVENALAAAGSRFPRHFFDIEPGRHSDTRAFVSHIRLRLPELSYIDDGAIDENGNFVFIETLQLQSAFANQGGLNCSGFAKWVVDGIIRPVTGQRLEVPPLAAPFGERGGTSIEHWEAVRDPFFGLDWVRNLAASVGIALRSPSFADLREIEVRDLPFSHLIQRHGGQRTVVPYRGFTENAGFSIEGLHPLMFTLAATQPGWIYLAAVNDEWGNPNAPAGDTRALPRLRQFFHIAVLVPFFNERGDFEIAVFESAEETSFRNFSTRYPGHFVNLVRIPIEGRFEP